MTSFQLYIIKSFKHDGHLHRMWMENWRVPEELLHPSHLKEAICVMINNHTRIREADGKEWISRVPGISFFIPQMWFNIVALIEEGGIRYYCNIASPSYIAGDVITYIDYDLDVIRMPDGKVHVVDQEEYERHTAEYHYSTTVQTKVSEGLELLLKRLNEGRAPFQDELVMRYFEAWEKWNEASLEP
jgi:protein associated with RNAse G/E